MQEWTEYDAGPRSPSRDRLHVTLNPRGVILLNGRAYETMGCPEAAVLLYDERRSMIGLRPDRIGVRNAFPLSQKGKNAHRLIYASAFCRRFGIKVDKTVVFPTAGLNHDGIMVLDMHSTTEVR